MLCDGSDSVDDQERGIEETEEGKCEMSGGLSLEVWERKGRMGTPKHSSEKREGGVPHSPFSLL